MRTNLNRRLVQNSFQVLAGLLVASLALADPQHEMIIDIDTDDFHIDSRDISHLANGDTETVYTDDGRTVDVLRTEQGVEIFIDGEKLDMPSPHAIEHEFITDQEVGHHKVLMIEKTNDIDDADLITLAGDSEGYEVIIIREVIDREDD